MLTDMETTLNNKHNLSNVAMKFCEMFTSLTCKHHETKIGGVTFWLLNRVRTRPRRAVTLVQLLQLRSVS